MHSASVRRRLRPWSMELTELTKELAGQHQSRPSSASAATSCAPEPSGSQSSPCAVPSGARLRRTRYPNLIYPNEVDEEAIGAWEQPTPFSLGVQITSLVEGKRNESSANRRTLRKG